VVGLLDEYIGNMMSNVITCHERNCTVRGHQLVVPDVVACWHISESQVSYGGSWEALQGHQRV
jgi:hypothetical protein